MKKSKNSIPLIYETHPEGYTGLPFITLIRYNKTQQLTVIDEKINDIIHAYVLDICPTQNLDPQVFLQLVNVWYHNERDKIPLSIYLSRLNLTSTYSKIHRKFDIDFITRIIGPVYEYKTNIKPNIKRRKRKSISNTIEIIQIP